MSQKIPQGDPIAAAARKAAAQRRIGTSARCTCGETRAEALKRKDEDIICAACIRKRIGKTTMDNHHIAGRANSPVTIPIPVNDHRARLSVDQYDWPKKTLENVNRSPLLAAAACIRGFIDTVMYLIEKVLLWIADLLEVLDQHLTKSRGSKWWLDIEDTFTAGAFDAQK